MRSVWALPSKPPHASLTSSSARSPLCPKGGWPRSWARAAVSTMSASQPSVRPRSRATWATSSVWVSRLRTKSSVSGPTTWVFAASRRSAAECTSRARSRSNGVRPCGAARLGGSSTQRARACSSYSGVDPIAATLLPPPDSLARPGLRRLTRVHCRCPWLGSDP